MKTKFLIPSLITFSLLPGLLASAEDLELPDLLADPGFESGALVSDGVGGWATLFGAAFSRSYSHSGAWSMACFHDPTWSFGLSYQSVPAEPGVTYTFTAWGLVPAPLYMGKSESALTMLFVDAYGSQVGISALPFMNATTPANTWVSASLTFTAPPHTTALLVDVALYGTSPGAVVYYDDLSLTAIPEPSSFVVLIPGVGMLLGVRRRR